MTPPVRYHRNDPHYVCIVVRPASVSKPAIHISVKQEADAAGNWMLPTLTISESIPQTTEDVMFMKSISEALLVACLEFIRMMEFM